MFYLYILLLCLPFVFASVFPTQPIQATVWLADQPMLVSWIEDWKYPALNDMGPLDISLWYNTDTYVASLASGVDPTTKARWVTVPGRALNQRAAPYTLRFTTYRPIDVVIYSADFTIGLGNATSDMGTGTVSGVRALASGVSSGRGNGTEVGSGFKTVPTSTGSGSTWTTTTTTTTTASSRFGSTTPSGIPPPSGATLGSTLPEAQRGVSAGRRGVDVEKLKFRFVFVIWPVLMGITMAL